MTTEQVNLLTLTEFYQIMSEKTGKPYLDTSFACYLFEIKSDAEAFSKEIENTSVLNVGHIKKNTFCTEFYAMGIKTIKVKRRGQDKLIEIPLDEKEAKVQFYNPQPNRLIIRLKQTLQKKYLQDLKDELFIAPILIDTRLPKQHPSLHYCYAKFNEADHYILFTTLQEFESWKKEQTSEWKPMEITIFKFGRIRKKNPVLINPMSDKLILTDKQIRMLTGGKSYE